MLDCMRCWSAAKTWTQTHIYINIYIYVCLVYLYNRQCISALCLYPFFRNVLSLLFRALSRCIFELAANFCVANKSDDSCALTDVRWQAKKYTKSIHTAEWHAYKRSAYLYVCEPIVFSYILSVFMEFERNRPVFFVQVIKVLLRTVGNATPFRLFTFMIGTNTHLSDAVVCAHMQHVHFILCVT